MKRTFVCVLKTGGFSPRPGVSMAYGPKHVQWLREQFRVQVARPHRFVCLSDVEVPGVETIPLEDDLPGWWNKLAVFKHFTDAAYVDLDKVIVGDVSCYVDDHVDHRFTASAGVYIRGPGQINTSVMAWSGDYRWLYERFMADKDRIMAEYVTAAKWGDQGFIRDAMAGKPIDTFQRMFPGSIVSFTRDVLRRRSSLKGVEQDRVQLGADWRKTPRFVLFNGRSKPWNVRASWIPRMPECA